MIDINQRFDTLEAAEAFKEQYLRSYHPAGYGTQLKIWVRDDGYWVEGYRWRSCD